VGTVPEGKEQRKGELDRTETYNQNKKRQSLVKKGEKKRTRIEGRGSQRTSTKTKELIVKKNRGPLNTNTL